MQTLILALVLSSEITDLSLTGLSACEPAPQEYIDTLQTDGYGIWRAAAIPKPLVKLACGDPKNGCGGIIADPGGEFHTMGVNGSSYPTIRLLGAAKMGECWVMAYERDTEPRNVGIAIAYLDRHTQRLLYAVGWTPPYPQAGRRLTLNSILSELQETRERCKATPDHYGLVPNGIACLKATHEEKSNAIQPSAPPGLGDLLPYDAVPLGSYMGTKDGAVVRQFQFFSNGVMYDAAAGEDDRIVRLTVWDPEFRTPEGIKIGDTLDRVSEESDKNTPCFNAGWLEFELPSGWRAAVDSAFVSGPYVGRRPADVRLLTKSSYDP